MNKKIRITFSLISIVFFIIAALIYLEKIALSKSFGFLFLMIGLLTVIIISVISNEHGGKT
ncbi:MAG: hypothetical protein Q7R96_03715 [Nanoarchaeota archaeon]|nr:hypothetical protein [Nanoarchaeota archaeon]